MINTSSINPEDVNAQVKGSLNLRTQVTIPNSQNCLWFYVIPSTSFNSSYSAESYARDTALAGKADLVFGTWEFGLGGFWKYENAPKAMCTATGSIKNFSLFGEFVYSYGADSEWTTNKEWNDKTSIFQATAGFSRYWKTQNILFAAQYYYDSNEKDLAHQYGTYGHNVVAGLNFGRLFGTTDFSANVFGMVNFGKKEPDSVMKIYLTQQGINTSFLSILTLSGMLNYSPVSSITLGLGPYITFSEFGKAPVVALKLNFTLGGGKY